MAPVAGYIAQVEINGVIFRHKTAEPSLERGTYNSSDSGTGKYEGCEYDHRKLTVNLSGMVREGVADVSQDPFQAPLNINADDIIVFKYYPWGVSVPNNLLFYWCPDLKVSSFGQTNNAESGPAMYKLVGQSNGPFVVPREVLPT